MDPLRVVCEDAFTAQLPSAESKKKTGDGKPLKRGSWAGTSLALLLRSIFSVFLPNRARAWNAIP